MVGRARPYCLDCDVRNGKLVYIVNGEEMGYVEAAERYGYTKDEANKAKNL